MERFRPRGWGCYSDGIRAWSCDCRPQPNSCIHI